MNVLARSAPALPANLVRVTRGLRALSAWPAGYDLVARRGWAALLALQVVLSVAACLTLVALYADGAWMVFAVADGHPWTLKWAQLASRASAYVTVVAPTELLTGLFQLDGTRIAMVYGLLFNLVQFTQLSVCGALAWRRHATLLLFPLAQYVFSTGIGFGFMSEAFLGPGFFWIGFFLIVRGRLALLPFALCFAGLVFCHEVMLPAAAVLAAFAWMSRDKAGPAAGSSIRDAALLLVCGSIFAAWATVRLLGGGADSDQNALTTLDPRRTFDSPTLWLLVAVTSILVLTGARRTRQISGRNILLVAIACAVLPLVLQPWLDFTRGRYDSARTLVGCELAFFGAWAVLSNATMLASSAADRSNRLAMMPVLLAAGLAINLGASAVFLTDWMVARHGFERLARSGPPGSQPSFLPYRQAKSLLTPHEIAANDLMAFTWTWPFRSAVLATDYRPHVAVFDPETLYYLCSVIRPARPQAGSAPMQTIDDLRALSCHTPPPPSRRRFLGRLYDRIRSLIRS